MRWALILTISLILVSGIFLMTSRGDISTSTAENIEIKARLPKINLKLYGFKNEIWATITAYNSVPEQTDSAPCTGAGGILCGRNDVIACPNNYPIGMRVFVYDKEYICLDRLNPRYSNRFDIFFDKDIVGAKKFGIKKLKIMYDTGTL